MPPDEEDRAEDDFSEEKFVELLEEMEKAAASGDAEAQDALGMAAMAHAMAAMEHYEPTEADRLSEQASECLRGGDSAGAEVALRRLIEIADQPMQEFRALSRLASLYGDAGRGEEALQAAIAAENAARRSEMSVLMMSALQQHADHRARGGDREGARALLAEALTVIDGEPLLERSRGVVLLQMARLRFDSGDSAGAERLLEEAWPTLAQYQTSMMMAQFVSALATWWALTARIRAARGEYADAVVASREAVAYRRRVAAMPQFEGDSRPRAALAAAVEAHADVLAQAGDAAGADAARDEAVVLRCTTPPPPPDPEADLHGG
ncbi:MAG TPA: hypothetical protein VM490_08630 [Armatimonadaceae bacterium]|nr:hypothetical protein [Armatimonadaceae bacterium]